MVEGPATCSSNGQMTLCHQRVVITELCLPKLGSVDDDADNGE